MNPTTINTGTTAVTLNITQFDNAVTVEINPDGAQGNGQLGWNRVFEANNAGWGPNNGDTTIDLSSLLQAYKSNGATSVSLAIVVSNWVGYGAISGSINWSGQSFPFSNTSIETWTSVQYAFTIVF